MIGAGIHFNTPTKIMKKDKLFRIFLIVIQIAAFIFVMERWGLKGLGVFALFMILIIGIRIAMNLDNFKRTLSILESKIWGKPLEKGFWEPDELKNKKVKIVWTRKKQ